MTVSRKAITPMTAEAFLDWSEAGAGEARAELLDGRIVDPPGIELSVAALFPPTVA